MNGTLHLWLIPLLPFVGFLLNGLFGSRLPKSVVSAIALIFPLGSLIVVANAFVLSLGPIVPPVHGQSWPAKLLPYIERCPVGWIHVANFTVGFDFAMDHLALVMLLVVTGVGFLIHIYSVGYMSHEEGYWRYFAYLNLFLFFMTVLVLAENALLMFVGWEGVGLASYLLIGFYFKKNSAADAGKKAFIVNRIGDFGFLIGIFLLVGTFGTLSFSSISANIAAQPALQGGVMTCIALCLVLGATGKSAQLPLYIWLPDAMEGPTPVSALIHAATMVTAGVYMIVRLHFIFDRAPIALAVVAIIGAATAIFASTIALVQNDIKRVLAYSTVSQLGYMFLGAGVAAYSSAIFHLMTHAFFKALLFLAAGSVIHALSGEQDLRRMGGLRKKLPITFWVTTIAVLAISGIPPFAGFFSKDEILYAAFNHGTLGQVLWFVGLVTALLTSFYMFRLWYLTFMGESRSHDAHPHESPWSMLGPLVILAGLSVVGGFIKIGGFLEPSVGAHAEAGSASLELIMSGVAVAVALIGWFIAHTLYGKKSETPQKLATSVPFAYNTLLNKYYVDEFYGATVVKPLQLTAKYIFEWIIEKGILGALIWLIAGIPQLCGALLQKWQSGNIRSYAAWIAAGAAVLLLFLLLTAHQLPDWLGYFHLSSMMHQER